MPVTVGSATLIHLRAVISGSVGDSGRTTISQGTQFGPFKILELIGSGGMGEVLPGRRTRGWGARSRSSWCRTGIWRRHLGRPVQRPGVGHRERRERCHTGDFCARRKSASLLNHPNICTIHDIGEQEGRPYLVMELLRGETLKDALRHETLSANEVIAFSKQMASGLAAAHALGIVHRDIKPANIFVAGREGHRQIKILDFGLAKQQGVGDLAESGDATAAFGGQATSVGTMTNVNPELTSVGSTLGTVAYMSPEQAEGSGAGCADGFVLAG